MVLCLIAYRVSDSRTGSIERLRAMSRLNAQLMIEVNRLTFFAESIANEQKSAIERQEAVREAQAGSAATDAIGDKLIENLRAMDLDSAEVKGMEQAQLGFARYVTLLDVLIATYESGRGGAKETLNELLDAKKDFERLASDAYGKASDAADETRARTDTLRNLTPFAIALCVLLQAVLVFRPLVKRFNLALEQDQESIRLTARNEALEQRAGELVDALEKAEAAARLKSEILANVSHELRTPLNGVLGMTSALLRSPLEPPTRKMVETIAASGDTLLRVIGDVLDFSKIEAGRLDIERVPVDIHEVAADVIELYRAHAESKSLELRLVPPPMAVPMVQADQVRLRQVLSNLVANGIKFTETGHVTVEWNWRMEKDQVRVVAWVKDTGIGIPADRLDAIFESFTQADGSTQRKYGGTGLGLAISRKLIEMMGGLLSVSSREGVGSTFRIEVPFEIAPETADPDNTEEREIVVPRGLRVLLAEDNRVNVLVATTLLEQYGCTVDVAENGLRAISLAAGNVYDLVMMDVQMPICDGLEATRAIRQAEGRSEGARLPIYALTANVMSEDRQECEAAGMDGFLSKPIRRGELEEALIQAVSERTSLMPR
jgi:signal transduction histidine kinase/ActR/RegA family two-component response regulator